MTVLRQGPSGSIPGGTSGVVARTAQLMSGQSSVLASPRMLAGSPLETADGSLDQPLRRSSIEQALAGMALVAIGLQRFGVGPGIMPRHFVAFVLLPVWFVALSRWRGARVLLLMGIASAASGVILARLAAASHTVSTNETVSAVLLVLGFVTSVCVVLWSRLVLSLAKVGLFFGVGLMLNAAVGVGTLGASNPLKYGWAIPISVVILAAVSGLRLSVQLFTLLLVAAMSILSDARAMFAVCVLSALLVAWQMRPTNSSRTKSWIWTAGMLAALGAAIYNVGTSLLVDGYLGAEAQARSVQQLGSAGSLILGGRPELAATAALFLLRPLGFGAGVSVSHGDLLRAKAGMSAINYDPDNGYVENYMFGGGRIELHSMLGDLWAAFGVVGIALVALLFWQIVRNVATLIAHREATGLVLLLSCWGLWNLFFSPFFSAANSMIITMGLVLPLHRVVQARAKKQQNE